MFTQTQNTFWYETGPDQLLFKLDLFVPSVFFLATIRGFGRLVGQILLQVSQGWEAAGNGALRTEADD